CGLAYGHVFLFVMAPPQARPTLVPYTTLFRSYFIPEYLRHFENAFVLVKGEYDEIFVFVDTHYPTIQFYTRRPGDSTCRILACDEDFDRRSLPVSILVIEEEFVHGFHHSQKLLIRQGKIALANSTGRVDPIVQVIIL